jgi:hypothetical protein
MSPLAGDTPSGEVQDPGSTQRSEEKTMTEMRQPRPGATTRGEAAPEVTGWVGWIAFGGIMMVLAGTFQAIAGLVALLNSDYYLVTARGLVVGVSYTTWGWVHLLVGVLLVATGLGVMSGQMWARVVGIAVAFLSAVVNLAFLAAYPLWSALVIVLDVLVMYALAVHGDEMRAR